MTIEPDPTVRDLTDLLEQEQAALLRGDMGQVADLSGSKARLITRLNAATDAPPGLTGLRRRIARNQDLLQSAMSGIRTVAERLARIQSARDALTVYGADGRAPPLRTRSQAGIRTPGIDSNLAKSREWNGRGLGFH